MNVASLTSLGSVVIAAAGTLTTTPVGPFNGLSGLSGFVRFAGTGGTSVTVYLQQLLDGDVTWADLAALHFTAAGTKQFALVQGAAAFPAITEGSLANDTLLNSGVVPLFSKFRLKTVSVGTWSAGLVSSYGMLRG
jgi:hypothetical protein